MVAKVLFATMLVPVFGYLQEKHDQLTGVVYTIVTYNIIIPSTWFLGQLLMLGACTQGLRLSICLFNLLLVATTLYTAGVRHVCNKVNLPANFAPNSKGFQLRDFAKNLSISHEL
jgi:hypothetical protein